MKTSHNTFQYVPPSVYKSLDMLPMLQAVSAGLALLEPWISTNREYVQLSPRMLADKHLLNLEVSLAANFLLKSSRSSTKFADRVRNTMKRSLTAPELLRVGITGLWTWKDIAQF